MNTEIFKKIGFTDGETKVYLALLKLGETTITPIVLHSKVSKSKIYDILERLIAKGLVGYVSKERIKYFIANDPKMILEYLKKKEEDLNATKKQVEKMLPQLSLERATLGNKKVAEIYQGFSGFKAIREELICSLKMGDEFLVLGAPKIANEKWEAELLNFHNRREAKGVSMRIIYNSNAQEFGKIREKFKLTHVKYLPNKLVSPNWIEIYKDTILFVVLLQEPITFVLRDTSLARSFRSYFDIMWKVSKLK